MDFVTNVYNFFISLLIFVPNMINNWRIIMAKVTREVVEKANQQVTYKYFQNKNLQPF
jgi:competence protein ComGC